MKISETFVPKVVELLSQITGEALNARDVTPPVLLLAAQIAILQGAMLADQRVAEEEKQHLQKALNQQRFQKTIDRLVPAESNLCQLALLLSKGIRDQAIYTDFDAMLTLLMPSSESEKLLLVGCGYEMASADGLIVESERNYLRQIANMSGLKPGYLDVLESRFTQKSIIDLSALENVRALLDPVRFHGLDILFVKAASSLLSALPAVTKKNIPKPQVSSYICLKEFQDSREQLDSLCNQLCEIIHACSERSFLPDEFVKDATKISQKLRSQRFRVAIVGEFNQGKSTLLNAMLGEDIQPVRVTPCSGSVTTLRYGDKKRVICCYKGGRQEEILVDDYKKRASIPKTTKPDHNSDEPPSSQIEEIIFEHPDLELCKNGVEILDSPGLNEHPNRTAITEKLLKDTDAAIFLTNASRLLSEKEKELIQYVRSKLTGSSDKVPAENLFVLVNFMDLLDNEEDRQEIAQRLKEFVKDENLIVANRNRIHYISAKAAIKRQDEYVQSFRAFTQAIEQFLTVERGYIGIKQVSNKLINSIKIILIELGQFEKDISLSQTERQQILEQIGEAGGRNVRIQLVADKMRDDVFDQSCQSFEKWYESLQKKILAESKYWHSEHSPLWSQSQLVTDYVNQFSTAMMKEIDQWGNAEFKVKILNPSLEVLEKTIRGELATLQYNSSNLSEKINIKFSNQLKLIINGIDDEMAGAAGFLGGTAGVALAAGLYVFTLVAIIPIVIAAVVTAIFGTCGLGLLDIDGIHGKIKAKVIEKGFEKFDESLKAVCEQIDKTVALAFDSKLEAANEAIQQIIACYENALQANEKKGRISLDQLNDNKLWISQRQQEIRQLQQQIEGVLK